MRARRQETVMPISDIPILSMLRTRMHWHQGRQRVLAENVANADTPNFKPRDLTQPKFDQAAPSASAAPALTRTNVTHLAGSAGAGTQFQPDGKLTYETRPAGNAVSLEDEMLKVAANQMDYQAATALYGRSLGLLKTAIGRR
jgi:flagellar basal-body rod protein FlgB